MKAGISADKEPLAVFPNVVGKPKLPDMRQQIRNFYIGKEAVQMRRFLRIQSPMHSGFVGSWGDMEKVWHHTFYNELKVDPRDHLVLLTEMPLNPKANRERMAETFFVKLGVKALYVENIPVLSLYASGRTTGVVLESGANVTYSIAVNEGYVVPHSLKKLHIGGEDLTNYLMKIWAEIGFSFTTLAERDAVQDIKETLCFVAEGFEAEMLLFNRSDEKDKYFELPDGNAIRVGERRFRATEPMFRPDLVGVENPGVHQILYETITNCDDDDLRTIFMKNVVLAGGNTLFPGFKKRLEIEISKLFSTEIDVVASPDRHYAAWLGGKTLVSNPIFKNLWISREEYEVQGCSIMNKLV